MYQYECWSIREAKTYKHANNVCVKKSPIWGKIFENVYAVLSRK